MSHQKTSPLALLISVFALSLTTVFAADQTKVTTIETPNGATPMMARTDAKGIVHLVMDSPAGPLYAKSIDNGQTFGKSIPIVDEAARKPNLEFIAWDLAVTATGKVHVAMGTNAWKLKLPKEEWGFFYSTLEPNADQFAPVRNINHVPSEGFSLAVDDKDRVAACWLADKLFVKFSNDGGKSFGETTEIDSSINPCNCCTTNCTFGTDGRLAILYREETNNNRDMYIALWQPGQNKVELQRVSQIDWKIDTCPMTYYSINAIEDGYLAVWPTNGKIYFAKLDANGVMSQPREIETPGKNGMRSGLFGLKSTNGNFLIAWKREGQLGWQQYDSKGVAIGTPGATLSEGKGAAGVVNNKGEFVLFR